MQRYSATNFTTAVNDSPILTSSTRDGRDTSSLAAGFSVNARRQSQATPYKLKCDEEPLNSRLGPPDFHPQSPSSLEETLTKEYVQLGYRETVDGIEETRETSLSQIQTFTKPVLLKCKESIRKQFRAINESRAQKRKAGQVYGVPFSGSLLFKPGLYPEQKTCGEDFRRKWIEGLSNPSKRLRTLTDQVPHAYRKKLLFEVLIRNNVPLVRATWFIKVTYLNQVRPAPPNTGISPGSADKTLFTRTELWTKDVIDYLQHLVDEFLSRNNSRCNVNVLDQSTHTFFPGLIHNKNAPLTDGNDGNEISFHFRWWYMVRMLQWHNAEGLIHPSHVADWILNLLEDKGLTDVTLLLLPLIYGVIDHVISSQTYARALVEAAVKFIAHVGRDSVNSPRRAYAASSLFELVRYLSAATPDAFAGLSFSTLSFCAGSSLLFYDTRNGTPGVSFPIKGDRALEAPYYRDTFSLIQRQSFNLRKTACRGYPRPNTSEAVSALNSALQLGDTRKSYRMLFEDLFDGSAHENPLSEVSARVKSSLKWIFSASLPFVSSVFLVCSWATSHARNFRAGLPPPRLTGRIDFSEIYIAVRLLTSNPKGRHGNPVCFSKYFQSPGPLHDILVCWIDQNDSRGEDFKRLQLLIVELVRSGIFYPQAYVRQLMVSGGNQVDAGRWRRHRRVLKMLPLSLVRGCLLDAQLCRAPLLQQLMRVYANERRYVLKNLHAHERASSSVVRSLSAPPNHCGDVEEVKSAIAAHLRFPKWAVSFGNAPAACEECRRAKRQKVSDESANISDGDDEEDAWWVRKPAALALLPDPFMKTNRPAPKGRQKSMRKTQSLGQLAAARIEGSPGASSSHVCDGRIGCPSHPKTPPYDGDDSHHHPFSSTAGNIGRVGRVLKRMSFVTRRTVSEWLIATVKHIIMEEAVEKNSSVRWRLGGNELLVVLYFADLCDDVISVLKFLLSLLPLLPSSVPGSSIHAGRNAKPPAESGCDVGDAFLVSSIRRYENVMAAADLVPDVLSAMAKRASAVMCSNGGRIAGAPFSVYFRYLLRKFGGSVPSVVEWENRFKDSGDRRLVSELDPGRCVDGDYSSGIEDTDDFLRQKIGAARPSRIALGMRDVVQRYVDEALLYFALKERKTKGLDLDKGGVEGNRIAKQIIAGLIDCIRQTGGAAQEGDPSLVCSAVSAVVSNVAPALSKVPDWSSSVSIARRVLNIHITCLCLLKEVLGERHGRAFEVALTTEATLALAPDGKSSPRVARITAAVSSLVVGIVVSGASTLERIVSMLRLKEGLDVIQFVRNARCGSNGSARARSDNLVDSCVHWFRLLLGNCRTVCDGLVVDLLGEQYVSVLSCMQRSLPLALAVPPAYSIFAYVLWRPILSNGPSDDPLFDSLASAFADLVRHRPFRDACLRSGRALYDIITADTTDAAFASILERSNLDARAKESALVPLRSRLFLDSVIECRVSVQQVVRGAECERRLLDRMVQLLDALRPLKLCWQWVELRLLLNEQAMLDRLRTNPESSSAGLENENNFVEVVLTRLLVRPDAAPLFSEVLHLFGKSLVDSVLLQVKWFLGGQDVLYGRKSVRQRLMKIAEKRGLGTGPSAALEEGEVVEGDAAAGHITTDGTTERALVELLLPCIDRSSDESRATFTADLIKQVTSIEQYIATINSRAPPPLHKHGGYRRSAARHPPPADSSASPPPCPATLCALIFLRVQLLLRLSPTICSATEMQGMRQVLASVIVRLLGSRVVAVQESPPSGERNLLSDWLVLFLHGLLSHSAPGWMRPPPSSSHDDSGFSRFAREAVESLQTEVERVQFVDEELKRRVERAMPNHRLPTPRRRFVSCAVPPPPGSSVQPPPDEAASFDPWMLLEDAGGSGCGAPPSAVGGAVGIDGVSSVKASTWLRGAVRVKRAYLTYVGPLDDA